MAAETADAKKRDFAAFKETVTRAVPTTARAQQSRRSRRGNARPVFGADLDLEDIRRIIRTGDADECRRLSYYFYRISGLYRNAILMLSNLSMYQTLVTPIFDMIKKVPRDLTLTKFHQALTFVDNLEVPTNFQRITWRGILTGIYYGILREEGGNLTIQDLPYSYCRSNFKDCNNLNIIEFNVEYFNTITDQKLRADALLSYPAHVRKFFMSKSKNEDPWIKITPDEGGCCFYAGDGTPLLIASIPSIYQLEAAIDREAKRDENELYKLLIERMPIDSKGELVFQLDEVANIHASVASMLSGIDTVDVLTTFGDANLESIQDSSAASQSADRIDKYTTSAFDNMGISSLYFNADTSSAMPYANAKDEAIISILTEQYARWIEFQVNKRFAKANLTFDVTIMPTTRVNRKEVQGQFFQGAQYGYSKMAAGVASGIKQINMIPIMIFENDYLHMSEKMMPLMSSYTSSGEQKLDKINGGNTTNKSTAAHISTEGGRPKVAATKRSDKTQANIDGKR